MSTLDYRAITVEWTNISNFNTSGLAKQKVFQIDYNYLELPSYYVSTSGSVFATSPSISFTNLPIDTKVKIKIGYKTDADKGAESFSPDIVYTTKSSAEVGDVSEYIIDHFF